MNIPENVLQTLCAAVVNKKSKDALLSGDFATIKTNYPEINLDSFGTSLLNYAISNAETLEDVAAQLNSLQQQNPNK
jgi:hypothetical protein